MQTNNKHRFASSLVRFIHRRAFISALFTFCLMLLSTGLFSISPPAYAASRLPKIIPPLSCLTVLIAVTNVHTVPLPKGTGTAYDINMNVINDCAETIATGGTWSLVSKLTCLGQTTLGFNFSGHLPQLAPRQAINVVDQSRVAYCNEIVNGVIVKQFPPDQDTFFGSANATTTNGIKVRGQATAYLF